MIDTREGLALQLEDLGFEVLPSQANFLLCGTLRTMPAVSQHRCAKKAVLVRHFRQPRIVSTCASRDARPIARIDALDASSSALSSVSG